MKTKRRILQKKQKKKARRDTDEHEGEAPSLMFADDTFEIDRKGDFFESKQEEASSAPKLRCLASIRTVPEGPKIKPEKLREMKIINSLSEALKNAQPQNKPKARKNPEAYDLWEKDIPSTKKHRPSAPLKSAFKAADTPPPGASYKPDPVEHQKLLKKAVDFIVKKQEEERKLTEKLRPLTAEGRPLHREKPIYADEFFDPINQSAIIDENEKNNETPVIKLAAKARDRLTRAQRNKQARKKAAERSISRKQELREKGRQIQNIKSIVEEVDAKEEEIEKRVQARKMTAKRKGLVVPHKFGSLRATMERPDVLLTEELPTNLRKLQQPLSLMEDRFKNLQMRNLAPVIKEKDRTKRRRKIKYRSTEKWYTWKKDE